MKPLCFLLLLAGTLSLAHPLATAEPRAPTYNLRGIYDPRCDDDDDDCPNTVTRTKSQSSTSPSGSNTTTPSGGSTQIGSPQTHATIVALACIVGILTLTIAVFFLWRKIARPKERGVRPYIEISDELDGARPASRPPQAGSETRSGAEEDPANLPPPVNPFLGVAPTVINYQAFGDLQGHWEQTKQPRILIHEPTENVQFGARFDYAPPGYRSIETIVQA
ncbi:hypothetical protein MSAN_02053500 [Mycena sanguinolenta]|uniref:Uncharacterized protein n=1 Tax=Mycena sanguinolenta TaxID=230812 RepID=A0A8H6XI95_9AGAR|nr:hypothetical protein MSAN_02053500 [Mycena sanguinolenta]